MVFTSNVVHIFIFENDNGAIFLILQTQFLLNKIDKFGYPKSWVTVLKFLEILIHSSGYAISIKTNLINNRVTYVTC